MEWIDSFKEHRKGVNEKELETGQVYEAVMTLLSCKLLFKTVGQVQLKASFKWKLFQLKSVLIYIRLVKTDGSPDLKAPNFSILYKVRALYEIINQSSYSHKIYKKKILLRQIFF